MPWCPEFYLIDILGLYRKSVPAASFVGLGGKAQVVRLDAQGLGRLDAESLQDLDGASISSCGPCMSSTWAKSSSVSAVKIRVPSSMRSEIIVSPPVVKRFAG